MKHLFTTAALLFSMTAFAQVGINNTSPKATLDITAKTTGTKPEGLIIPQLAGNDIRTATTAGVYGTNQKGLIIYATSADSAPTSATANITAAGYYYFDGTNWQKISTGNTVSTTLASGNILVGSSSNVATAVSPTGDVTISNTGVTSIGAGKVTNSQMASAAALTVKGNATNAAASPTDISAGTDGYVLRRSGTALGFGTVATAGIADGAVTAAKLNQMSATSGQVLGWNGTAWTPTANGVSTTLNSGNILVGNASNVATAVTPTGDVTISNTGVTSIGAGKVTNSQMANSAALTVKGNATNASAAPTDIAAGTDGYVLRRSGTTLGFGTVATAGIADGAVTAAKLNQMSASTGQVLSWNGTSWAPAPDATGLSTILGSGKIYVGNASSVATAVTPTGDVTIDNAGITSIGAGKVTNSQMANSAALTVKGNATNASAAPTDIAAGTDGYVLRRSGTTLGFGTVATAGIADGAVTAAKLNQMSATSGQVLGWNGTAWAPTASDTTNDAWINDTTNGLVKLGTKADGTARAAGTDFVVKDNGQVGIGTSSPDASAALEIASTNKGILIPRVALTGYTDQTTVPSPANGLMVYNMGTGGLTFKGFVFWNGAEWRSVNNNPTISPAIVSLNCTDSSTFPATFASGMAYNGTLTVPYTGGNGGSYSSGASFSQNGLTFTLNPGTLNYGNGSISYSISGTPNFTSPNTISVPLSFLGQSCNATVGENVSVSPIQSLKKVISPIPTTTDAAVQNATKATFGNLSVRFGGLVTNYGLTVNSVQLSPAITTQMSIWAERTGGGAAGTSTQNTFVTVNANNWTGWGLSLYPPNKDMGRILVSLHATGEIYRINILCNGDMTSPTVASNITFFIEKL
ncbi:hypothetical protein [Flavobacterium sp. B17]|uniref:beta strand repeat-containing protein n=1 Tax=Flavobacterium sp. B17 TaxID=95618 RepID=UPI000344B144|nr:hypothetical protein [Flavobacterium sp. B17]